MLRCDGHGRWLECLSEFQRGTAHFSSTRLSWFDISVPSVWILHVLYPANFSHHRRYSTTALPYGNKNQPLSSNGKYTPCFLRKRNTFQPSEIHQRRLEILQISGQLLAIWDHRILPFRAVWL